MTPKTLKAPSVKEVHDAMRIIKRFCEQQDEELDPCFECVLGDDDGYCVLANNSPDGWEI